MGPCYPVAALKPSGGAEPLRPGSWGPPAEVLRLLQRCLQLHDDVCLGAGGCRASELPHHQCGLRCRQTCVCMDHTFSTNGKGQLCLKKMLRDYFLPKSQFPQIGSFSVSRSLWTSALPLRWPQTQAQERTIYFQGYRSVLQGAVRSLEAKFQARSCSGLPPPWGP